VNECGTCLHWMIKRECPREARGAMVHAGMPACDKYSEVSWFTKLKLERGMKNV